VLIRAIIAAAAYCILQQHHGKVASDLQRHGDPVEAEVHGMEFQCP
jgi:hypothetical protein